LVKASENNECVRESDKMLSALGELPQGAGFYIPVSDRRQNAKSLRWARKNNRERERLREDD
jgi:hypothetical protein